MSILSDGGCLADRIGWSRISQTLCARIAGVKGFSRSALKLFRLEIVR
jgi:hypothetical protein